MRILIATLALTAALLQSQAHATEAGPPSACITGVYDAMSGTWGIDDETFVPNHVPVSAWTIIEQDSDLVAMLTNGETNVWFLTEHGADWTHDQRNGSYEGLFIATDLISCDVGLGNQPGILETQIFTRERARMRHRIEISADRLVIAQFDRRGALVSERRMRRYAPMPVPLPAPAPPASPSPPKD